MVTPLFDLAAARARSVHQGKPLYRFLFFVAALLAAPASPQLFPPVKVDGGPVRVSDYSLDRQPATQGVTIDVMILDNNRSVGTLIAGDLAVVNEIYEGTGLTFRHVGSNPMPNNLRAIADRVDDAANDDARLAAMSELLEELRYDVWVDTIRRGVGADLVVAATRGIRHRYAGIALQPGPGTALSREGGFSVVAYSSREHAWVLAHELGHNLGLAHEDDHEPYLPHGRGYIARVENHDGNGNLGHGLTLMAVGYKDLFYDPWWRVHELSADRMHPDHGRYPIGDSLHRNFDVARSTGPQVTAYEPTRIGDPEPEPDPEPDPDCEWQTGACLENGFTVFVEWRNPSSGTAHGKPLTPYLGRDSAVFWFFDPDNAEVLVKVLDGCAINGYWWVYSAPATDLEHTVIVWPPWGGSRYWRSRTAYREDESFTRLSAVTDNTAFPCTR